MTGEDWTYMAEPGQWYNSQSGEIQLTAPAILRDRDTLAACYVVGYSGLPSTLLSRALLLLAGPEVRNAGLACRGLFACTVPQPSEFALARSLAPTNRLGTRKS